MKHVRNKPMANVLILTDQFVSPRGRMAGLQIRTYEMARALSRSGHSVTIAAVNSVPQAGEWGDIALTDVESLGAAPPPDVWISHPLLVESAYKRLKHIPLVVDGYEFPFASFYANAAAHQRQFGDKALYAYHSTIVRYISALSRADKVLCATNAQRIGYLSLLSAIGRINPKYANEDILLTVSSGAPPDDSDEFTPASDKHLTVLWAGGCYPWFDIETYVQALDHVIEFVPGVRFVFAGIAGVDRKVVDEDVYPAVKWLREYLSKADHLERRSSFVDWLPYDRRRELYRRCSLGVCTHRQTIESTFAMRTRVIDMIWGGLPVVCTSDDYMSTYVQSHDIGVQVDCGDATTLGKSIATLLLDSRRRDAMSERAHSIARNQLSWDSQILPLHNFCLNPVADPSRSDRVISRTLGKIFDRSVIGRTAIQNNLLRLVSAFERRWHEISQ